MTEDNVPAGKLKVGSRVGSGFISQRYESADPDPHQIVPDPHQIVTDPQQWYEYGLGKKYQPSDPLLNQKQDSGLKSGQL
jgi:hypothetical protein